MMQYSIFTDADWLFPDSAHSGEKAVELLAPRGGHGGAQILCDLPAGTAPRFVWEGDPGPEVRLFQLLPVGVNENTSATLMTTTDYESCRDFVTRRAPFQVYDALRPLDGPLPEGRTALYLSVEASAQTAPGTYTGKLLLTDREAVPVRCRVSGVEVPAPGKGAVGVLNFFDYDNLAAQHGVEKGSEAYWALFRQYVRAELDMRCTHILLPPGEAVFEEGRLTGFDFTLARRAGRIAAEEDAPWLCGGHIAHWHDWDDGEYYPNWDQKTGVTTPEGYLQMQKYFRQWRQVIEDNGWQGRMAQALADEPQTYNDKTYRVLAGMCRKFLPGVPIIDAVETTNLGGGIDIWVPKQDTYEKWREAYETLKAAGEEMWFYTCAFPAGAIMNRSMDLPLTASRAVMWMGALYRLSGFLHWGFNYYIGEDIWNSACCPHKGALLPAGDAHIVYPGPEGPWRSMRFEAQRSGVEEWELLARALRAAPEETEALLRAVCSSFREYTREGKVLLAARAKLIRILERADLGPQTAV